MRQTVDLRIHWELHVKVECALGVGKFDYLETLERQAFARSPPLNQSSFAAPDCSEAQWLSISK
jgi:hypothetical protein